MEPEVRDIFAVHLAGVIRHGAGEVDGADDGNAMLDICSPVRVSSQLPPRSAARSTMTEPGPSGDHLLGDQHRRLLPGNHRGRDHNVALGNHLAQQFALALIERFVLRLGVAAGILSVFSFDRQFDESASQTLTCSLTAGRTSYADTTAPSLRAVAMACSPATPAPITSTRDG